MVRIDPVADSDLGLDSALLPLTIVEPSSKVIFNKCQTIELTLFYCTFTCTLRTLH